MRLYRLSGAGFPYTERSTGETDKPRGRVGIFVVTGVSVAPCEGYSQPPTT
nr:MAG TPA: hypothetical protein [Caudoviricetes sp.]